MIHTLKHTSIRLWTSIIIAGPLALFISPAFDLYLGFKWGLAPFAALFSAIFLLTGFIFNRVGSSMIRRRLREATTWERAGKFKQAEKNFSRATAVFDSFIISPRGQKKLFGDLIKRVARFHVARAEQTRYSESLILSYLKSEPGDAEVAETWLSRISEDRPVSREIHEVAALLGDTHPENITLQNHLARIYIGCQRTDFPALSTYKTVLKHGGSLADRVVDELSFLFTGDGRVDDLALSVYVLAWDRTRDRSGLAGGISACCRWLKENDNNSAMLARGRGLIADISESDLVVLEDPFLPPQPQELPGKRPLPLRFFYALANLGKSLAMFVIGCLRFVILIVTLPFKKAANLFRSSERVGKIISRATLFAVVISMAGFMANTAIHLTRTSEIPAMKATGKIESPLSKLYTVQVAAYLKQVHAQNYVAELKSKKQDAYFVKIRNRGKTWYQVRISHFPDRDSARKYGSTLRSKGVVDDFYVAVYQEP